MPSLIFASAFVTLLRFAVECNIVGLNAVDQNNVRDLVKFLNEPHHLHHSHERPEASADDIFFSVDDIAGVGRVFDGIGAISGGGATSKLLMNYPEPHRSNILDYLFKPGFAASLQILKVEIGGDSQSSDGSESSHMHTAYDENYSRGYEWWLMKEAKKRNPAIKFYGLPWTFPGWIGGGVFNPFINSTATVRYILNWINGAKTQHNLTIDYIGIWNERTCDPGYVKLLRKTLNADGHSRVKIVVPDAMDWSIVDKLIQDPTFAEAVDIIGQHYPGAVSPESARKLQMPLWASEEYSTSNDLSGGGCWARILNESPVNAMITSFIAWNLIASYYDGFPYTEDSLMSANEPWSGHYVVNSPIWATAHHTQFYNAGWYYLLPYHGLGNLSGNGTYIALTSPDRKELTIVIETVESIHSPCSYPMPHFTIAEKQTAIFSLDGSFRNVKELNVWYSRLDFNGGNDTVLFKKLSPISVTDGMFSLVLSSNEIYTLTTLSGGQKGDYGTPPNSQPFPSQYSDTFENYEIGAEPFDLSQQSGAFEVTDSGDKSHGKVMTQVVTQPPVDTCLPVVFQRPATLIGDYRWKNVHVEMDVYLDKHSSNSSSGVYLASQVDGGGCNTIWSKGIYYWISVETHLARLSGSQDDKFPVFDQAVLLTLDYGQWFTMGLDVRNKTIVASLNGAAILDFEMEELPSAFGFVALGPETFGVAHFDNLSILRAERVDDERYARTLKEKQRKNRQPIHRYQEEKNPL